MNKITVLLAMYNGARHLQQQLDSIAVQAFTAWDLLVSDDGSTDDSRAILARFATRFAPGRVRLIEGPRRGSAANFLHLLTQAPEGAVAFCDQDDRWRPDKLARAVEALAPERGPAIYSARTTICDENLVPLAPARLFHGPFGFENALVQCATAGNTIVLNPAGAALVRRAAPAGIAAQVPAHDWFAYQVLTGAGGAVVRDTDEVVFYRQHAANLMGRNDTFAAGKARFRKLFDGEFGGWLHRNIAALSSAGTLLPEHRATMAGFARAIQTGGPRAVAELSRLGIHRQTRAGTMALYLAAAGGRLRSQTRPPDTPEGKEAPSDPRD